jgi:hypothetical protein
LDCKRHRPVVIWSSWFRRPPSLHSIRSQRPSSRPQALSARKAPKQTWIESSIWTNVKILVRRLP